jgi:hypothetical protein
MCKECHLVHVMHNATSNHGVCYMLYSVMQQCKACEV